jgi:hypothetical protein
VRLDKDIRKSEQSGASKLQEGYQTDETTARLSTLTKEMNFGGTWRTKKYSG